MNMGMASTGSDDQTSSTSYPFYVELDSSENLMLGQHVYIERDMGQDDKKDGLWLSDYYILDTDTNEPYVWAANDKNRLEKRYVTLGKHDDSLGEYESVDGLTKKDAIAFPTDSTDMESGADSFTEPDMEEDSADTVDDSSEDMIDPNEELVPIDEAPGMSADGNVEGIE